ncbi:MAG: outer membrane beta-barrel protein [Vitreimonas sp.]
MVSFGHKAGAPARAFSPSGQRLASQTETAEPSHNIRLSNPAVVAVLGGLEVRLHPAVTAFAASLIAFAPFQAFAQDARQSVSVRDRPRPEYDPLGLRFGGFDLNAQLDVSATSTDNLFAAQTGEQDDIYYTVSPSARLSSHWSRHALAVSAGLTHTTYSDHSNQNSDTGYIAGQGRYDLGADTQINATARYGREVEPRTNPDALTTGKPVEYTVSQASLSAQHTFNRFKVGAGVDTATYDYHDVGIIDQDFRDVTQNTISGSVEAELGPRFGVTLQASADHRDYNNAPALSSDGQTYLAGVALHLTDLLEGHISAGVFNRDYDSGVSLSGFAADASVDWYITQLTTIQFSASRSAQDNGATAVAPYVESRYGAHVDHELLRNVILSAGVQGGQRDYSVIDRNDTFLSYQLGADYILNRRVAVSARYSHDEVNSDGLNRYRDYTVNAVSLGLSLRL